MSQGKNGWYMQMNQRDNEQPLLGLTWGLNRSDSTPTLTLNNHDGTEKFATTFRSWRDFDDFVESLADMGRSCRRSKEEWEREYGGLG